MSREGGWEAEVPEPYGSCFHMVHSFWVVNWDFYFFPPHHMLKASGRLFFWSLLWKPMQVDLRCSRSKPQRLSRGQRCFVLFLYPFFLRLFARCWGQSVDLSSPVLNGCNQPSHYPPASSGASASAFSPQSVSVLLVHSAAFCISLSLSSQSNDVPSVPTDGFIYWAFLQAQ